MRQIVLFLVLILFSCKGQSVDTLEEIKSSKPNKIEVIGINFTKDTLSVMLILPKKYIIKSDKTLKLGSVSYHKHPNNNFGTSGSIFREDELNLNDTINFDIIYITRLIAKDFRHLINNNIAIKEKERFTITNNQALYQLLNVFKNDEILFKYEYLANPKELQVLSIPVNLE